jgi:hypothetical protein
MSRQIVVTTILTGLMMLVVGYVDLTASEIQAVVLILLVGGFILGALATKRAWVVALLIGLAVPVAEAIALIVGFEPAGIAHSRAVRPDANITYGAANLWESFIALIPAFVGTYTGVIIRYIIRMLRADNAAGRPAI